MVEKAVLTEVKENGVLKYFHLETEVPQVIALRLLEIQKINDVSLTRALNSAIAFFTHVIKIAEIKYVAFLRSKLTRNTSIDPEFLHIPHSEMTAGKPVKLIMNITIENEKSLRSLQTRSGKDIDMLIALAINLAYKCEEYEHDGKNLFGRPREGFVLATTNSACFDEFAHIDQVGKPNYF